MNDDEILTLGELERDIETLREFLEGEEPKIAEEAPKPKPKAKSKPKAEDKAVKSAPAPAQIKTEAPARLYGAAKLRAKRGR